MGEISLGRGDARHSMRRCALAKLVVAPGEQPPVLCDGARVSEAGRDLRRNFYFLENRKLIWARVE